MEPVQVVGRDIRELDPALIERAHDADPCSEGFPQPFLQCIDLGSAPTDPRAPRAVHLDIRFRLTNRPGLSQNPGPQPELS